MLWPHTAWLGLGVRSVLTLKSRCRGTGVWRLEVFSRSPGRLLVRRQYMSSRNLQGEHVWEAGAPQL